MTRIAVGENRAIARKSLREAHDLTVAVRQ
jgi:hypothetical protein